MSGVKHKEMGFYSRKVVKAPNILSEPKAGSACFECVAVCQRVKKKLAVAKREVKAYQIELQKCKHRIAELETKQTETQLLELTTADLWAEKDKTMAMLNYNAKTEEEGDTDDDSDADDDDNDEVHLLNSDFREESLRLIDLYGEGHNGDVLIKMLDETTVVVVAHGFAFSFPRLVRNSAFIQVLAFDNGHIYRLEFETEPLPERDGRCNVMLEQGPDVEFIASEDEFLQYTEREDWSWEHTVVVTPLTAHALPQPK